MYKIAGFSPLVVFTLLLVVLIAAGCNQPYSAHPGVTNTPINPDSLFATPLGQTPAMGQIEAFGTGTALALSAAPFEAATQTLLVPVSGTQGLNVTATATPPVAPNPTSTLAVGQPSSPLTFSRTASPQTYSQAGETITFTYTLTNTGTVPLGPAPFTIIDNVLEAPVQCGAADSALAPGQSLSCSASYIITQGDLSFANLTSIATISAGGQTSAPVALSILNLVSSAQTPGIPATPSLESEPPKFDARYVIVAPLTLKLNESDIVELHLSRSLSIDQISAQIIATKALATSTSQAGTLVAPEGPPVQVPGGALQVTRFMRVTLQAAPPDAFDIRVPPDENVVKAVNPSGTVIWQWQVQARRAGVQRLIFYIEQQSIENNVVNWQSVATERRVIQVNVTIGQRLGTLDWKWITGTMVMLIAIAVFWRLIDVLQRRSNPPEGSRYRRGGGSQPSTQQNALSRLPRLLKVEGDGSEIVGNIFISYRRSDSADIAGRIYDRLIEEFGPDPIFKDVDSIPLGVDFKSYLDQKVGECKALLAIIGDRWVDATDAAGKKRLDDRADFVRVEIESALKKDIPVIPLLVRGAQMPEEERLPYSLRRLVFKNGIQIRPDPDFHHDMDRLISALYQYVRGKR